MKEAPLRHGIELDDGEPTRVDLIGESVSVQTATGATGPTDQGDWTGIFGYAANFCSHSTLRLEKSKRGNEQSLMSVKPIRTT